MNEVMVIPKRNLSENVTDEVNSSEVDLSSFALRDELFPGFGVIKTVCLIHGFG